jgi:hypothetical protein
MAPGVTKARARKYTCKVCDVGYEQGVEHECDPEDIADAKAARARERREGVLPDARHQILTPYPTKPEEKKLRDKDVPLSKWRTERLALLLLKSRAPANVKGVACAILRDIDWLTHVYFQSRRHLADAVEEMGGGRYCKRIIQKAIEWLVAHGVVLCSNAQREQDDGERPRKRVRGVEAQVSTPRGCRPELLHLHYDPHSQRLVQPKRTRDASTEWKEGVRLIEWAVADEKALVTALSQPPPHDRSDHGGGCHDRSWGPVIDPIMGARDRIDHPFHQGAESDESRDLRHRGFHSSLPPLPNNPTLAPSPLKGDLRLDENASATPTDQCKSQTEVASPEAAQEQQSASAPRAPIPTREELAEIEPIVSIAMAAKRDNGTRLQEYPGPLRDLFVRYRRKGVTLDDLDAFVLGVAEGTGEAAAARDVGYAPFLFAAKTRFDFFVHIGRDLREEPPPLAPAARERLSGIHELQRKIGALEGKGDPAEVASVREEVRAARQDWNACALDPEWQAAMDRGDYDAATAIGKRTARRTTEKEPST